MTDSEHLAAELGAHMRKLRHAGTQPEAIAWMKAAYLLMERAADDLRRPRLYSVPSHFGAPTLMVEPPKAIALPPGGLKQPGPVWLKGETVVYGDQNRGKPWTRKDTRRLERVAGKKG